jgi:hypothetical protein
MRTAETPAAWKGRPTPVGARRDLERLWLALGAVDWTVVVIVPADPDASAAALASALAEAGKRLSHEPVTALTIEIDQDPKVLADVQQMIRHDRERAQQKPRARAADAGTVPGAPPAGTASASGDDQRQLVPSEKTVISIPPVIREPLGVALAQASDGVVVALQLRRTRIGHARRTVELIGRSRIIGSYVVR